MIRYKYCKVNFLRGVVVLLKVRFSKLDVLSTYVYNYISLFSNSLFLASRRLLGAIAGTTRHYR